MILLVGVSQLTPKLEQVVNYVDPAAELLTLLVFFYPTSLLSYRMPHHDPILSGMKTLCLTIIRAWLSELTVVCLDPHISKGFNLYNARSDTGNSAT